MLKKKYFKPGFVKISRERHVHTIPNFRVGLKGGSFMLGIPDAGALTAYVLSFFSTALCIAYGLINWNKGSDD
jgi:hypothetical protein